MTDEQPLFAPIKIIQKSQAVIWFVFLVAWLIFFVWIGYIGNPANRMMSVYMCIMPLLLIIALAFLLFRSTKYYIFADRVEKRTLDGEVKETIMLSEITSWDEILIPTKVGTTKFLYVFKGDKRYLIGSPAGYANYDALKKHLTQNKERNYTGWQQGMITRSKSGFMKFLAVPILLFAVGMYTSQFRTPVLMQQQLTTLSGTLDNIHNTAPGKHGYCPYFTLQNYPGYVFDLANGSITEKDGNTLFTTINIGDTIAADITTDEYAKKIIHQIPLNDWEAKHRNRVSVYNFTTHNIQYAWLNGYNHLYGNQLPGESVSCFTFGVWALLFWLLLLFTSTRIRERTNQ